MMEWQSLESVPRDGTQILIHLKKDFYDLAKWVNDNHYWDGLICDYDDDDIQSWHPIPHLPKKKHLCEKDWYKCTTNSKGDLILSFDPNFRLAGIEYFGIEVKVCPFCGEKA